MLSLLLFTWIQDLVSKDLLHFQRLNSLISRFTTEMKSSVKCLIDCFFYIYQGFLLKTLKQIVRNKSTVEGEQIEDNLFDMNKSDAEKNFESTIQKGNTTDSQETSSDKILIEKIIKIGQQTRKNFKTDPFEYYEQFREQDPLLYELAIVVFAAPATQVSVERAFNALKLLLSPARYNLKKETLENILLINLNRDLLNIIDFEQMEA